MKSSLFAALTLAAVAVAAADVREIELRRLFEPTAAEIQAEREGRIFIYEGLRDKDMERAMEEEFDRIDTMMFIRIQVTDDQGEPLRDLDTGDYVVQDDGC
jgi:hypothetical protein